MNWDNNDPVEARPSAGIYRWARVLAGTALLVMTQAVSAHEGAKGVVKERMDLMKSMAKLNKRMRQRVEAKHGIEAIKKDAESIRALSARMTVLFPPGSMQHPTEANGKIWQNWADFERKAKALQQASAGLAVTTAADIKSVAGQVRAMSRTCRDCHEHYRTKR
jgi:cytochrome c556